MKKTIKIKDTRYHNTELNLPVDGKVKLNHEGKVEVSAECAKHVLTIPEWIELDEDGQEIGADLSEAGEANAQGDSSMKGDKSGSESDISDEELDALTATQLKELAKGLNIPNWQKFQKNKATLKSYIRGQLKKEQA